MDYLCRRGIHYRGETRPPRGVLREDVLLIVNAAALAVPIILTAYILTGSDAWRYSSRNCPMAAGIDAADYYTRGKDQVRNRETHTPRGRCSSNTRNSHRRIWDLPLRKKRYRYRMLT